MSLSHIASNYAKRPSLSLSLVDIIPLKSTHLVIVCVFLASRDAELNAIVTHFLRHIRVLCNSKIVQHTYDI